MYQRTLADDAADCRQWADEFDGQPERAILLRLSSEFLILAAKNGEHSIDPGDVPYFAQRATQEITAAVKAKHPKARLAHLKMAQHYEALSQSMQ
jgi:hypothetical protein